eukprot:8918300-Pyramimonas_sp.AAC.1
MRRWRASRRRHPSAPHPNLARPLPCARRGRAPRSRTRASRRAATFCFHLVPRRRVCSSSFTAAFNACLPWTVRPWACRPRRSWRGKRYTGQIKRLILTACPALVARATSIVKLIV